MEEKRKRLAEIQRRWYHKAKNEKRESYARFRAANKQRSELNTARKHANGAQTKRRGVRISHLLSVSPHAMKVANQRIGDRSFEINDCIETSYSVCTSGYPEVQVAGKKVLAAHVTLMQVARPASHLLELSHLCHNRRCVNPAHLTWESRSDNMKRNFE